MPPASIHRFFVPLILLAACATDEADLAETAQECGETPIGQWISFDAPPRPTPEEGRYPKDAANRSIISRGGDVALAIDPTLRSPVTTVSGCNWWLTSCFTAGNNLDDCYLSSPRCEGDTPWLDDRLCCPQACYDDYAQRRRDGAPPTDALLATHEAHSCFPGLDAYIAGGAP
jgi:hypothetical protein